MLSRAMMVCLAVSGAVAVGCASEQLESTDAGTTPTTVPAPTTTLDGAEDTTTSSVTTTTSTTSSTTTVPTTTTTTAPTTSAAPPVTLPRPAGLPATVFAVGDGIVEVDVATGDAVRTVVERFSDEGVFRGDLRLLPGADRSAAWFAEGYEDGWYACESSVGMVGLIDLATGDRSYVGDGFGPAPSVDGTQLAYVSSGICLPDPEAPDFWVLTPPDRVVLRDVASGAERAIVTATAPDSYDSPHVVRWAEFAPDGSVLVGMGDDRVRRVNPADPAGSDVLDDHPVVLEDVGGSVLAVTDDALFVVEVGDEGSADLERIALATGERTRLASSESAIAAAFDRATGWIAVSGRAPIELASEVPVVIVASSDDLLVYDLAW